MGTVRRPVLLLVALALALAGLPSAGAARQESGSLLISNALVLDGSGAPARAAAVRITGDRIVAVGDLDPRGGERTIDAAGRVLAPGFIDTHSHHDRGLADAPDAIAAVNQGITTIVVGQDGGSQYPIADLFRRFEQQPAAVNLGSYVGHGTLRRRALGENFRRTATPAEIERMARELDQELAAGALGLSTGLEYDPGIYSAPEEVLHLARVAARAGTRYASHVRSEDREFWKAVDELVAIGRETGMPVHLSHMKLALRSDWGKADRLIRVLDEARAEGVRVTGDIYPYPYWHSSLTVLYPRRDFTNRATTEFILAEISTADGLLLNRFAPDPSYEGRTIAEIAGLRGTDPATTLMALIAESEEMARRTGGEAASVIGTSMDEPDIARLMQWPHANICSDGASGSRHPRGFGAFTRVLGRYVRERRVRALPDAIRKMTSLGAEAAGIPDRGVIRSGAFADLVLFDPATVTDRATTGDPHALSTGMLKVWVNGELVYEDGRSTGRRPGRALRRAPAN